MSFQTQRLSVCLQKAVAFELNAEHGHSTGRAGARRCAERPTEGVHVIRVENEALALRTFCDVRAHGPGATPRGLPAPPPKPLPSADPAALPSQMAVGKNKRLSKGKKGKGKKVYASAVGREWRAPAAACSWGRARALDLRRRRRCATAC